MGHRLGTADQACDITDEERREDQAAIAVNPSGDRAQDVVKNTQSVQHDKRMNDCLPPILFSAIFKLLKVLPDTELDAC